MATVWRRLSGHPKAALVTSRLSWADRGHAQNGSRNSGQEIERGLDFARAKATAVFNFSLGHALKHSIPGVEDHTETPPSPLLGKFFCLGAFDPGGLAARVAPISVQRPNAREAASKTKLQNPRARTSRPIHSQAVGRTRTRVAPGRPAGRCSPRARSDLNSKSLSSRRIQASASASFIPKTGIAEFLRAW